jgi:hypothetical protein
MDRCLGHVGEGLSAHISESEKNDSPEDHFGEGVSDILPRWTITNGLLSRAYGDVGMARAYTD